MVSEKYELSPARTLQLVLFREADLAAVTDSSTGLQVGFSDIVQLARGSSEFSGAANDLRGVADEGEPGLREWHGGGYRRLEVDVVAGFGDPVMLDVE